MIYKVSDRGDLGGGWGELGPGICLLGQAWAGYWERDGVVRWS